MNLLIAIHDLPDANGQVIRQMSTVPVYWRDLPEFATAFRTYGICKSSLGSFARELHVLMTAIDVDGSEDNAPKEDWYEQVPEVLNATTFAAEFLSRASFETHMMFFATGDLASALERGVEGEREEIERMYLPVAETWIRIAGKKIYQYCDGGSLSAEGYAASGPLWEHGNEVSVERWKFWKERFASLAEDPQIGDEAGGLAASAVVAMDQVDKTSSRLG